MRPRPNFAMPPLPGDSSLEDAEGSDDTDGRPLPRPRLKSKSTLASSGASLARRLHVRQATWPEPYLQHWRFRSFVSCCAHPHANRSVRWAIVRKALGNAFRRGPIDQPASGCSEQRCPLVRKIHQATAPSMLRGRMRHAILHPNLRFVP